MAVRNNVAVYALRLRGESSLNVRALQGQPVLDRLTEATGGRQFQLEKSDDRLAAFFAQLQEELRSQYSIGYQFQGASLDRGFHKIAVKLKQPGLRAFTRQGYYSDAQ
jgi:VWFA-related protein